MQSSVKDTYIAAQSRMMYTAYLFYSILCAGLITAEFIFTASPNPTGRLIIVFMTVLTAMYFTLLAMLIVEVVYQDELQQLPLVASLSRLTPELNLMERYTFLAVSVKRQIVTSISVMFFWIAFGGTPRGASLTMGIVMITVLTAYGMSHLKDTARNQSNDDSSDDMN